MITRATVQNLLASHDSTLIDDRLSQINDIEELFLFIARYTSWNSVFGSGVSSLAGLIGQCRHLFNDPQEPIELFADRSVLIASYVFDAARDEFDDRENPNRDTHRCLAQSLLIGLRSYIVNKTGGLTDPLQTSKLCSEPEWLRDLQRRALQGYGRGSSSAVEDVFSALGYHVASEVLADQEFSKIDKHLRENYPEAVDYLKSSDVDIAGVKHNAYHWLNIHSGHGGGVEDEHFKHALEAANLALKYAPLSQSREYLSAFLNFGFQRFVIDHKRFFKLC